MDRLGNFEIRPFSKYRKNITLIAHEGWRRHTLNALIEVDVTEARNKIREIKMSGRDVSFTAWIIKCLTKAIEEYREINAYRLGRNKIVIFDDVDVAIPVEKDVGGEKIPTAYIIRRANEKSIEDITKEIRDAQKRDAKDQVLIEKLSLFERLILRSPTFVKRIVISLSRRRGMLKKKHIGTVGVTSVGMFGGYSGWIIPLGGVNALLVGINSVIKKPWVVDNRIKARDILHIIVSFDHDMVDGANINRFLSKFIELLEGGFGLDS